MSSEADQSPELPEDVEELKKFALRHYAQAEKWKQAHDKKHDEFQHIQEKYHHTLAAYEQKTEEYKDKVQEYLALEEKYRILRHALFGRSSEKWSADEIKQALLFNEAETYAEAPEEENTEEVAYTRKKPRGKRKPIPEEIPREEVIHDISEEEKLCACGAPLTRIGEETSEKLEIIPAQVKVIRHIRPKYACKACEGTEDEGSPAIKIAPAHDQLLPKSIASAGLLSYIVIAKYEDALPLARQEKIFDRIGVDIHRQSMSRWIIKIGERLSPLMTVMDERIIAGQLLQMDETRIQVHNEPGKENAALSWMWVARGGPPTTPITRYMYHRTREGAVAENYLAAFKGYLQSDAYGPYNKIGERDGVVHVGCLAHVRRKFAEADKAAAKGSAAAKEILSIIGKIYRVEKELRAVEDLSQNEFVRRRREKVEPLFDKLEKHLGKKMEQVPPSTALGKAVSYAVVVLPKVRRFLDLYHLTPDNNAAERAIRPFVVGRKNWQFSDTPRGAHASAAFYSLIESAKGASLKPYWYIRYVLQKLPEVEKSGAWESLLPANLSTDDLMTPSFL